MRLLTLILSLALATSSFAETVVFRNASVISMTSPKFEPRATVIVTDGKIEAVLVGAAVKLPEGARVIDATGKFLMPGLGDMHAHIPAPNSPPGMLDDMLFLYLANGITTIRGMQGFDGQLNLREYQRRGELAAPNLYLAGPMFNGQTVKTVDEAVARVRTQKKEGWDLIKVHGGLTREVYDAIARTAKQEGIRFAGHVAEEVGLQHAIEMGQETFDHIDGYVEALDGTKKPVDPKKLADLVKRSKKAGVWIVPTSALWEVLFNGIPLETLQAYEELKYVPQGVVNTWSKMYEDRAQKLEPAVTKNVLENRRTILAALHKGGVKILMGTDAPQQFSVPGFSLHRELRRMREAGMTNYDILRSATANVGEYFGKRDSFGTIEPGKRADLVLLNDNPLTDITSVSNIDGVMVAGRWYSREDLDARLEKIERKYQR